MAAKKPAAKGASKSAPKAKTAVKPKTAPSVTAEREPDIAALDSTLVDPGSERDVAEHENETLVIPADDDFAADQPTAAREPTEAEREAIDAHLELRVSELATYVRAEAAKFGVDPHGLADLVHRHLRALLG